MEYFKSFFNQQVFFVLFFNEQTFFSNIFPTNNYIF
jgi:hypothetical protein